MLMELNKVERKLLRHLIKKELKVLYLIRTIDNDIFGIRLDLQWLGIQQRINTLETISLKLERKY